MKINNISQWINENYERTKPKACPIPIESLLEDADRGLRFIERYWKTTSALPGLEIAGLGLTRNIGDEIDLLKRSLVSLQAAYNEKIVIDIDQRRFLDQARQLLSDLKTFLEWYTASTDNDSAGRQNARVTESHEDTNLDSPERLAAALFDYASLTKDILRPLGNVGDISIRHVDDAFDVVSRLIDISAGQPPLSDETKEVMMLKQRCMALLHQRLEKLRHAARFVFRKHPDIVRQAMSTYTQTQNAAEYRAKHISKAYRRRKKTHIPLRYLPSVEA